MRIHRAHRELIQAGGDFFQLLGLPRPTGEVFGLFYLSSRPLAVDDVAGMLNVDRATANTCVAILAKWRLLQRVKGVGSPHEHFEAVGDPGALLRAAYREAARPRILQSQANLKAMLDLLEAEGKEGTIDRDEAKFSAGRVKNLIRMHKKILGLAPIAEKLL